MHGHSWAGPYWFAKSVTWKLSEASRAIMGKNWCKDKDAQQESSNDKQ